MHAFRSKIRRNQLDLNMLFSDQMVFFSREFVTYFFLTINWIVSQYFHHHFFPFRTRRGGFGRTNPVTEIPRAGACRGSALWSTRRRGGTSPPGGNRWPSMCFVCTVVRRELISPSAVWTCLHLFLPNHPRCACAGWGGGGDWIIAFVIRSTKNEERRSKK